MCAMIVAPGEHIVSIVEGKEFSVILGPYSWRRGGDGRDQYGSISFKYNGITTNIGSYHLGQVNNSSYYYINNYGITLGNTQVLENAYAGVFNLGGDWVGVFDNSEGKLGVLARRASLLGLTTERCLVLTIDVKFVPSVPVHDSINYLVPSSPNNVLAFGIPMNKLGDTNIFVKSSGVWIKGLLNVKKGNVWSSAARLFVEKNGWK